MEVGAEMNNVIANGKRLQESEGMVGAGWLQSTHLATYHGAGPSSLAANDQTQYPKIKPSFSENTARNGSLNDILLPFKSELSPDLCMPRRPLAATPRPLQTLRPPLNKGTPSYRARHIYAERKRRKDTTFLFGKLRSLLPTLHHHNLKVDRCTIVDNVINYVQELNKKVQALENVKAKLLMLAKQGHKNNESTVQECNKQIPWSFSTVFVRMCGPMDIFITLKCPKLQSVCPNLINILEVTMHLHIHNITFCSTPLFSMHSIYAKVVGSLIDELFCETLQNILRHFVST